MNIFDIFGGGASSSSGMGGGLGGLGSSLGGIGGAIGSVLQNMAGQAKETARDFSEKAPGGMGGLLGAGALGALLGNVMSSDMVRNATLVGAGAVAWNFYKKWARQKQAEQAGQAGQSGAAYSPADDPMAAGFGSPAVPAAAGSGSASHMGGGGNIGNVGKAGAQALDPTAELVARAMVYAARADGQIDASEESRMRTILKGMLPEQDFGPELEKLEKETIDPARIARQVVSPEQAEDVYRLSCSVIDIDHFMETSYLQALARELGLDEATQKTLQEEAGEARRQLHAALGQ